MNLRDDWEKLDQRFRALKLRERKLVAIGACVVAGLLTYRFGVEPIVQQSVALQQTLKKQKGELLALQAQTVDLKGQLSDPDAANRKELASIKENVSQLEQELKAFDALVVAPDRMPRLLQALLKKHSGLELLSLKTLPVSPLLAAERKTEVQPKTVVPVDAANTSKAPPLLPPGGMYRHRMEITVAGSYGELLAYAEELQRISPRPLWSEMRLKVVEYPRSELTFTLYTLSLDPQWLAV